LSDGDDDDDDDEVALFHGICIICMLGLSIYGIWYIILSSKKSSSRVWENLVRFWGTFWWWIWVGRKKTVWDATAVPRTDPTGVGCSRKKQTFSTSTTTKTEDT
jgi:hypothetical protein